MYLIFSRVIYFLVQLLISGTVIDNYIEVLLTFEKPYDNYQKLHKL